MPREPTEKKGAAKTRLFLLSPAFVGGKRAQLLLNPRATFPLALTFHAKGLPLADVFAFASGLYFRGKITYARRFARPDRGDAVRVITSNRGLLDPDIIIGPKELVAFGATQIDEDDPAYHEPLRRAAATWAAEADPPRTAILLGSVATMKYRRVLVEVFGPRLMFPGDFVGRGDMSRGSLLLQAARAGTELSYLRVHDSALTGARAPGVRSR
jgi:hypothetical protein